MKQDEFFNRLKTQLKSGKPFVAWQNPNEEKGATRAMLQEDSQEYLVESYKEEGFVFASFEEDGKNYLIPQKNSETLETFFSGFLDQEKAVEKEVINFPPSAFKEEEKQAYETLVENAISEIKAEKLKKVVVSRKEKVETQLGAIEIFQDLLKKYKTAFVYCWFHPKTGIWLGATPETLLKVQRNKFKTMALAGTQVFKGTTEVNWGNKEIDEQQIVTDYVLENLKKFGFAEVFNSEVYTTRAGNVLHLRTDIQGKLDLKNFNLKSLVKALHPTPAICGMPKEKAREFILKNENYHREFYTGFLGELNLKKEMKRNANHRNQENRAYGSILKSTSLFVNLRCMKIESNEVKIFIGGGITANSEPAAEFEETRNKAQTLKAILVK